MTLISELYHVFIFALPNIHLAKQNSSACILSSASCTNRWTKNWFHEFDFLLGFRWLFCNSALVIIRRWAHTITCSYYISSHYGNAQQTVSKHQNYLVTRISGLELCRFYPTKCLQEYRLQINKQNVTFKCNGNEIYLNCVAIAYIFGQNKECLSFFFFFRQFARIHPPQHHMGFPTPLHI